MIRQTTVTWVEQAIRKDHDVPHEIRVLAAFKEDVANAYNLSHSRRANFLKRVGA